MPSLIIDPETVEKLLDEGAMPISKLVRLLPPARGKARDPFTLVRWIKKGVGGVRMEGLIVGGGWWSGKAALARFLSATTGEEPAARLTSRRIDREEAAMRKALGKR